MRWLGRLIVIGELATALVSLQGATAQAKAKHRTVFLDLFGDVHLSVSAPRLTYRRGVVVPITIRITNDDPQFAAPIRWSCHQFVHFIFVRNRRFTGDLSQELGLAPVVHSPTKCGSSLRRLHPGQTWTAHQDIILRHRYLVGAVLAQRRRTDTAGLVDVVAFTPVLSFTLIQ